MDRGSRVDHGSASDRRGSVVYRLQRVLRNVVVQVTVVGADAATLEDAAGTLADLLARWDLDDPDSGLSRLWRPGGNASLDDRTLLLLLLTTPAEVDLRTGTATVSALTPRPSRDVIRALAIDMVVQDLLADGAVGACVAVATHVRATGAAPTGSGWLVPAGGTGDGSRVRLRDGACVTVRGRGDEDLRAVTVVGTTAWTAAVTAVAAAPLSFEAALQCLRDAGLPARLERPDGVVEVGEWFTLPLIARA